MPTLRSIFVLALALAPLPALAKSAATGKPAFKAGDPPGYWIWADDSGWHLRATTGKAQHTFRGVINAEAVTGVTVTRTALNQRLQASAKQIKFEFDLFSGVDGLDWQSPSRCLTFELRLDGKADPSQIHDGQKGEPPADILFDACR